MVLFKSLHIRILIGKVAFMKYLCTLIIIFNLAFALPGWSEESDLGFNFEEMENLNVLLCTDETNKNNKKAFAISKNKDGTYDVFSDNFGLIKLTEVEQEAVLQAAKAVNGQWVGVDFMPAKNRDKDAPYIIEVNHSPGTEGINKVIDGDINKIVLDNLLDRDSWKRSATECGVLETLEVEGQELTVKMATGNNTTTFFSSLRLSAI